MRLGLVFYGADPHPGPVALPEQGNIHIHWLITSTSSCRSTVFFSAISAIENATPFSQTKIIVYT